MARTASSGAQQRTSGLDNCACSLVLGMSGGGWGQMAAAVASFVKKSVAKTVFGYNRIHNRKK